MWRHFLMVVLLLAPGFAMTLSGYVTADGVVTVFSLVDLKKRKHPRIKSDWSFMTSHKGCKFIWTSRAKAVSSTQCWLQKQTEKTFAKSLTAATGEKKKNKLENGEDDSFWTFCSVLAIRTGSRSPCSYASRVSHCDCDENCCLHES